MESSIYPHSFKSSPIAALCEEDSQEKYFDVMVNEWVNDKISYAFLIKNYPDYEASMFRRFLNFITTLLT
jgi:hypothetical protein